MKYQITSAKEEDRAEIMSLYEAQKGRPYCPWDEDYPSNDTIDFDLSRGALFVLKIGGRVRAAISIDDDEDVAGLPCWSKDLSPGGELSRLAVFPDEQNKGFARIMLQFGMD